jgi:hypothetical protein
LFVVAVAGGVVVADLVWENTAAGQVTVFSHTVGGYPEGWTLAIAAGLGFVVALLLVASVNSTKRRRARRKQLRRLRHGLEDQVAAPEPDHAGLLEAFFGPEQPSGHLEPQRRNDHPEPLYEQARRAAGLHQDWDRSVAASQGRRR